MAAEVLAGITVATVGWDHAGAARLRAEQQHEIDVRYAEPDRPPAAGPDPRDQVDPSNVFATLLLRVDGEPAAHAALRDLSGRDDHQGGRHPDGTAEVKRVYVAPGHRGRGLSRTLMSAVEDVARAAGVRHLVLESGLMQPESLGLYLRLGYDPVAPFGVFSDEPGSRCFGKWLDSGSRPARPSEQAEPRPLVEPVETLAIREVPWTDPAAAALRRAMWAFHQERYPEMVRDIERRGGHDVADAERGRAALATFVATLDGQPVGCATVAAAQVGPEHLTADPLRGIAGLAAAGGSSGDRDVRGFEMRNVFVDPAARRAGVATALVRQVEAEARRRGGQALYLGTGVRQPEALRLSVQLGYRPVLPYPPHDPDTAMLLFLGKPL
ncbi:GNAT family N-acetyltransferase [Promicromonospora iranensis]|uniref:GNAT superfamily N-acetyltransferase n=1 Tax=Promicromonospora iranensis TaxID=1105144 RepID=A0ABU2CP26_9MICO|nr:GNAT family N-acetyltransferase [Promicromonospora iranensis]MDR7383026.1 GNAT superfamily N-acetyltransferase [Promicromonospora iranensis]